MPTRIYFPSTLAAPCSPAYDAEWNHTGQAVRHGCWPVKLNSAFANLDVYKSSIPSQPYDLLHRQFISSPLLAQTISGTVEGQFRAKEYQASDECCRALVIKVVSGDGLTVRGMLLSHFPGAKTSEFVVGTFTNRNLPPSSSLTAVVCQNGDRLVFELGHRAFAITNTQDGFLEIGDNSANDLPEDEVSTSQYCPWIEFSADLQWQGFVQGDALGTLAAYDAASGIQGDALGVLVAYSLIPDVGWVQADAAGVMVAYGVNPPTVTRRVFPVPNRMLRYQTQWGKRTFPVSYWD